MNDITKPADELSANARSVLQNIDDMRAEIAWQRDELHRLSQELAVARGDNDSLHGLLEKTENERGYYQRWTVELITQLNTVGGIIDNVMLQAKQGAARPNGAAPAPALPASAGEAPLPRVVTSGPA